MDYLALKSTILATQACAPYIITNDMPKDPEYLVKDQAIADILNTPTGVRLVERYENFVGVMGAVGVTTYNDIMRKLEVVAVSDKLMNDFILAIRSDKGINFGSAQTQAILDNFVTTSILTSIEAEALKGIGKLPSSLAYDTVNRPVTAKDVSIALRNY